ncbi:MULTISPECIES: hypothetical protein [Priestia]|uniref:hypothetical protein n=1 Tax=Priestia TaxID=2800373 RepID=UPI0005EC65F5|nr:hypothetical protein [Priestia aryabhattai]KJL04343.1 hypothetical protein N178_12490 [Priestia aryabhattai B8W22]
MIVSSAVSVQKLNENKEWTELFPVPYTRKDLCPFIILNSEEAGILRPLEGQTIRLQQLEINEAENPVAYHCWEIRKWTVSDTDFIIASPPERHVKYYTIEIKDEIETP